jgi:putative PIN family toxin of toxin-antitoxin system
VGQIERIIPVVIDTNVVISALLFGGTPGNLLPLWKSNRIRPYVSKKIIDEYLRVLAYPKFQLSADDIHYILRQEVLPWFEVVACEASPAIISADQSDDMFIRCAEAAKVRTIISGDKHLLSLKLYGDIIVVSPSFFLIPNLQRVDTI